jgi:hypothetical protein
LVRCPFGRCPVVEAVSVVEDEKGEKNLHALMIRKTFSHPMLLLQVQALQIKAVRRRRIRLLGS